MIRSFEGDCAEQDTPDGAAESNVNAEVLVRNR